MSVADPEVYNERDLVILYPELDGDGNWVAATGFEFTVDGMAVNSRTSPWPAFIKCLGGIIRIKRVT